MKYSCGAPIHTQAPLPWPQSPLPGVTERQERRGHRPEVSIQLCHPLPSWSKYRPTVGIIGLWHHISPKAFCANTWRKTSAFSAAPAWRKILCLSFLCWVWVGKVCVCSPSSVIHLRLSCLGLVAHLVRAAFSPYFRMVVKSCITLQGRWQ